MAAVLSACVDEAASGDGSGGGGGGEPVSGVSVAFAEAGPLVLAPGQDAPVVVFTRPPGEHEVSFLLLGESLDASLASATAMSDAHGAATVTLKAPSKSASFELRAAVGDGPAAALVVEVSELGTGVVRVSPIYEGVRSAETWTAVVVPRATCSDLTSYEPDPEGALTASADAGEPLLVAKVPVGPRIAVVARSEQKISGCADAVLERAGETEEVEVTTIDRPMQLAKADLAVTIDPDDADQAGLESLLDAAAGQVVDATFPADEDGAARLLDVMTAHLPTDVLAAFATARDQGLDDEIAADLLARGVTPRDVVAAVLDAGHQEAVGSTRGRLRSADYVDHAVLGVERFLGVSAPRAGVPTDHLVTLVANPGDLISMSGVLYFLPSRLVGALAEDHVAASEDGATAAEVLAAAIGCADVAAVVGPLGDCDGACAEAACLFALEDLWASGLDASAEKIDLGSLTVVVSGAGDVDQGATLIGFEGTWIGVATAAGQAAEVGGDAVGEPPPRDEGDLQDGSDAPSQRE